MRPANRKGVDFLHPLLKKTFTPFMLAALFTFPSAQILHAAIPHSHDGASIDEGSHLSVLEGCSLPEGGGIRRYFDAEVGTFVTSNTIPEYCRGSSPDSHTNALWDFIHFSLAHEEKKYALAAFDPLQLSNSSPLVVVGDTAPFTFIERIIVRAYERHLSRGVLAHRTFG